MDRQSILRLTDNMSEQPTEPGWYNDPEGVYKHQAYWDGEAWTGEIRPTPKFSDNMSEQPTEPGWYNDPEGVYEHQEYWDGEKWTGETRPTPKEFSGAWAFGGAAFGALGIYAAASGVDTNTPVWVVAAVVAGGIFVIVPIGIGVRYGARAWTWALEFSVGLWIGVFVGVIAYSQGDRLNEDAGLAGFIMGGGFAAFGLLLTAIGVFLGTRLKRVRQTQRRRHSST